MGRSSKYRAMLKAQRSNCDEFDANKFEDYLEKIPLAWEQCVLKQSPLIFTVPPHRKNTLAIAINFLVAKSSIFDNAYLQLTDQIADLGMLIATHDNRDSFMIPFFVDSKFKKECELGLPEWLHNKDV